MNGFSKYISSICITVKTWRVQDHLLYFSSMWYLESLYMCKIASEIIIHMTYRATFFEKDLKKICNEFLNSHMYRNSNNSHSNILKSFSQLFNALYEVYVTLNDMIWAGKLSEFTFVCNSLYYWDVISSLSILYIIV